MAGLQFHRLQIGFNGRLEGAQTTMITARILLASALLAGVSWGVWRILEDLLGVSLLAQIVSVGAAGVAGLLVYMRAVLDDARARGPPGEPSDPRAARPGLRRRAGNPGGPHRRATG